MTCQKMRELCQVVSAILDFENHYSNDSSKLLVEGVETKNLICEWSYGDQKKTENCTFLLETFWNIYSIFRRIFSRGWDFWVRTRCLFYIIILVGFVQQCGFAVSKLARLSHDSVR